MQPNLLMMPVLERKYATCVARVIVAYSDRIGSIDRSFCSGRNGSIDRSARIAFGSMRPI
jgi:hypothetical protein